MEAERVEFTDVTGERRELYLALRRILAENVPFEEDVLPDDPAKFGESFAGAGESAEVHLAFVSVYGLVLADGYGAGSADDPRLVETALGALAGFRGRREVFEKVIKEQMAAGTGVSARQVAEVARQLVERGVGAISPDRLRALAVIYHASGLEEAGVFRVVDRIAERFQAGMLPISRGAGGEGIDRYLRDAGERFTEAERTEMYARAFGATADSEFHALWRRFVAAVTAGSGEVQRVARELAILLSAHGSGVDLDARQLAGIVDEVTAVLSDPEVLGAYGVKNMWQLVQKVSEEELGASRDAGRHRTMAAAGARILGWLADHADGLSDPEIYRGAEIRELCERWSLAARDRP
jgi:hypothetical protein